MDTIQKSHEYSLWRILLGKYGKLYIFGISIITVAALTFVVFTGLSLYRVTNKYFLLEKDGIQTNGEVINKEEVGFDAGFLYIYYKFTDDKNYLMEAKQEVSRSDYNKIHLGDIIKVRYLKNNPAVNGIISNKAEIIGRLVPIIIPLIVFIIGILVIVNLVNKSKRTIFLINYGKQVNGKITKILIKRGGSGGLSGYRQGSMKIYYEFYDDKGALHHSKQWVPNLKLADQIKEGMLVDILYDGTNAKKNEIYQLIGEFVKKDK